MVGSAVRIGAADPMIDLPVRCIAHSGSLGKCDFGAQYRKARQEGTLYEMYDRMHQLVVPHLQQRVPHRLNNLSLRIGRLRARHGP
jgi:hypothetical protein